MKLIIGLGNPGIEYKNTRHNVGFDVLDQLASDFSLNKPMHAEIAKIEIEAEEILLAKPTTFMNKSGLAAKKLYESYNFENTDNLLVVHDDVAIELGTIKISKGKSAGNHNGVQSVMDHLGTDAFVRVRCGIGRGEGTMTDVVLSKFNKDEKEIVETMIEKASQACTSIVVQGIEKSMNEFN